MAELTTEELNALSASPEKHEMTTEELFGQGISRVESEPISPEEEANYEFQKFTDKYGDVTPGLVSGWPATIGSTAGSIATTLAALKAPLPPQLGLARVPLTIAANYLGDYLGGAGGQTVDRLVSGPAERDLPFGTEIKRAGSEQANAGLAGNILGLGLGKLYAPAWNMANRIPGVEQMTTALSGAGERVGTSLANRYNLTQATLDQLKKGHGALTMGQQVDAKFMRGVHKFLMAMPIGAGHYQRVIRESQPAAFRQLQDDMIEAFWQRAGGRMGPDETANLFNAFVDKKKGAWAKEFASDIIGRGAPMEMAPLAEKVAKSEIAKRKAERYAGSAMYTTAYDLLPDKEQRIIPPEGIYELAKSVVEGAKPGLGLGASKDVSAIGGKIKSALGPQPASEAMQLAFRALPKDAQEDLVAKGLMSADGQWIPHEKLTVHEADYLRSVILEEGREVETRLGSKNARLSKAVDSLEGTVKNQIYESMKDESQEAAAALLAARANWAKIEEKYGSDEAQKIARYAQGDNPKQLLDYIFAPGATNRVNMAKEVLDEGAFKSLADTWKQDVIEDALKNNKSIGTALEIRLRKQRPDTLRAILGSDDAVKDMYAMARIYRNTGADFLETKFLENATKAAQEGGNASALSKAMFASGDIRSIIKYRTQLPEKVYRANLAQYFEDMFKEGDLSKKIWNIKDNTLLAMVGGDRQFAAAIRDIAKIDTLFKQVGASGIGVMPSMVEAGAILGAVRNLSIKTAGTVAGVTGIPSVVGWIMANKKAALWMAKGAKDPARMRFYVGRATNEAVKYAMQEYRESQRPEIERTKNPSWGSYKPGSRLP